MKNGWKTLVGAYVINSRAMKSRYVWWAYTCPNSSTWDHSPRTCSHAHTPEKSALDSVMLTCENIPSSMEGGAQSPWQDSALSLLIHGNNSTD
jgi:hypothetical protein